MSQTLKHTEPKSFREDVSKEEWVKAMKEELVALELPTLEKLLTFHLEKI